MPPRKRPAPPPEEPRPSSKPAPDAKPSEPTKSAPDSATPTISAAVLAKLPNMERQVYTLIFEAGSKGMWMLDVRKQLTISPNVATKVVRTLVGHGLLKEVEKLGAATVQMIHHGILRDDPKAGYTIDKVRDIVKTMVLDKVLEEVKSTGEGDFAAVRSGTICYRLAGAAQGGMMEGIPCGVCPRIDECSPDGVISPSTCVYYKKWLEMDF
uniref:DNA-directed RNA polymerase III subunit RPC6 n=1 Tax=Setaria viridis TaxID=4556 RepID=A0A4U6U1I3_SETVI|nr:hypothetical protein SEVIR_7G302100v2 [Setaria viridis]